MSNLKNTQIDMSYSQYFKECLEYDYLKYRSELKKINQDLEKTSKYNQYKVSMLNNWIREGVFHRRLNFENGNNFYITTSSIKVDYSFNGDFIVSYWGTDSNRAEALMQFEVGDMSPANGKLTLSGDFTPLKDDLTNIKYKGSNGKFEFLSAKKAINDIGTLENKNKSLIDTNNFFRLSFNLAGIGDQSKALYDTNSAIIDGAAGTGKSTIALQKLKYLHVKKNIPQENMAVIVKNEKVIPSFRTLLHSEALSLHNITIQSASNLLEQLHINFEVSYDDLKKAQIAANKINHGISRTIQHIKLEHLQKHFNELVNTMGKNVIITSLKEMIAENSVESNIEKYHKALSMVDSKIEDIPTRIFSDITDHNHKSKNFKKFKVLQWIKRYIEFYIEQNKIKKQLSLITVDTIRKEELQNELKKEYKVNFNEKVEYEIVLNSLYIEEEYIKNTYLCDASTLHKQLVLFYTLRENPKFDTIIVDEAQDYTLIELELLRLQTKRIILTGDILQNLQKNEVKSWKSILNVNEVYDSESNEDINIFKLKHNFRQTYQLANASYNYRQLLLNESLEDIEQEYYLSEKELNGKAYSLPVIQYLKNRKDFLSFVEEKVVNIHNKYSSKIPIVLIYKTDMERDEYMLLLNHFKVSENITEIENIDILLVNVLEAKGKEYPVVIADLDNLSDNEIYLIMTRAQFELDFVTKQKRCENEFLSILLENQWIEQKSI